ILPMIRRCKTIDPQADIQRSFPSRIRKRKNGRLNLVPRRGSLLCCGMISLSIAFSYNSTAQVIGNWNFNNTINGTGSIYNSVSSATFSAAVPSTSFNGGTEYYGHNG